MKLILAFTFLVCLHTNLRAQTAIVPKVHAYSQTFSQGARPVDIIDENGNNIGQAIEVKTNYLIYAEQLKKTSVNYLTIWIHGEAFALKADSVTAPVTAQIEDEPKKRILVPATKNKVVALIKGQEIKQSKPLISSLKKMIKENEVVILYRYKGKNYYKTVKKIKELPAVAGV